MNLDALFKNDQQRVNELTLTDRQLSFLKKLRLHDMQVFVSRMAGKLRFHGPVIGSGPMPSAGRDA